MNRTFLLLLLSFVTVAAGRASADARTLLAQAVVLRGRAPTATLPLAITSGEDLELRLAIEASEVVNLDESTLGVSLDDRPLRSLRLREVLDARRGTLVLRPDDVDPGAHLLRVRAHIVVDDDACLERFHDEAWLRIDPSSEYEEARSHVASRARPNVRARVEASFSPGSHVRVSPELAMSQDAVLAAVDLVAFAATRGTTVQVAASEAPDLVLRVVGHRSRNRHRDELDAALEGAGGASAMITVHDEDLVVVGRSASDVRRAVRALAQTEFLGVCGDAATCFVPDGMPDGPEGAPEPTSGLRVRSLRDVGYVNGFVVRDLGQHLLRFVVRRPAEWQFVTGPVLRLPVDLPGSSRDRGFEARITVTLNEQPVDTFVLDEHAAARSELRAVLPRDVAASSLEWVVDVAIRTKTREGVPCDAHDSESTWVRLDPEGGLEVERTEAAPTGIAAFFEATRDRLPELSATTPIDTLARAFALGRLVAPMVVRAPEDAMRFAVHGAPADAEARAQLVVAEAQAVPRLHPEGESRAGLLRVLGEGTTNLPLLPKQTSTVLVHAPSSDGTPRLFVVLPDDADAVPAGIDLASLRGEIAVGSPDGFRAFGTTDAPTPRRSVRRESAAVTRPTTPSVRAKRLRMVDQVWASVVLGTGLLALVVHVRRRARRRGPAPDDLEVLAGKDGART